MTATNMCSNFGGFRCSPRDQYFYVSLQLAYNRSIREDFSTGRLQMFQCSVATNLFLGFGKVVWVVLFVICR